VSNGQRRVVHVSTALDTRGGISAVIDAYVRAGVFARWNVVHVPSHTDRGGRSAKLQLAFSAAMHVWTELAHRRIALLHVHTASGPSFWRKLCISAPVLLSAVPVVLHVHGGGFADFYRRCGPLRRAVVRRVLERSTRVLALTDDWARTLRTMAPKARVEVLANPVEIPPHASTVTTQPRNVVLYLGLLQRSKGAHDLLEAFAALPAECAGTTLVLAGVGDIDGLKRRAEDLGISDRVKLPGWIGPRERERWLSRAACLALPSYAEGLPMAVLEAMAHGVPVVASAVGGIPQMVRPGKTGFLMQPGDIDALENHLAALLLDEPCRHKLGHAARELVELEYATPRVLARLEAIYASLGIDCPA
jgi:glycosyltransferase involved in cell wall biosynthesis